MAWCTRKLPANWPRDADIAGRLKVGFPDGEIRLLERSVDRLICRCRKTIIGTCRQ